MLKLLITLNIIAKIKVKNKLYKKLIKTKNREIQTQFDKMKNEIKVLTCKNNKEYCKNYFNKHNDNLKRYGMISKKSSISTKINRPCPLAFLNKIEF